MKTLFIRSILLIITFFSVFLACSESTSSTDEDPAEIIYICNQDDGTITIIDAQKHKIVETLKLADYGYSTGSKPHHIVVEEDGSAWYVSLVADGKVLKFSAENELLGTAETPTPGMMALHPTQTKLYSIVSKKRR